MPLKYMFDQPLAVKYVGMAHGILFIIYLIVLLYVGSIYKWKITKIALYGLCSFLPLAPFWVEKQVNKEIKLFSVS